MHQSAPFSILSAMLIVGIFAGTTPAVAQQWPQKPLKIVVAFPPGTPGDITVRGINDKLGAALGQPVVIENRPGAGGNIGAEAVGIHLASRPGLDHDDQSANLRQDRIQAGEYDRSDYPGSRCANAVLPPFSGRQDGAGIDHHGAH